MAWQSLIVAVDRDSAEPLSDALLQAGAASVSLEDADAGSAREQPHFGEPSSAPFIAWSNNRLVALFPAGIDVPAALARALECCDGVVPLETRIEPVEETDWVRRTQAQFEPVRISERLWIVPSWHRPPDLAAINLVLDPGRAFGTGTHPTTRLCLEWLEQTVRGGETMLDYGCGSGILAIAAARLGAARVLGVDIDPAAVEAARDNARANRVTADFADADQSVVLAADLIAANILANPLILLAPSLARLNRTGGRIVLAGLLSDQIERVGDAYAPYYDISVFGQRDGWAALEGVRR